MGQDRRPEAGEELLTLTESPYQLTNNLEEVEIFLVEDDITREDMENPWSTEELLGQDKREILVWHHRLNHWYFKYLLRLSNRRIITRKFSKVRKYLLVLPNYLESPTRGHEGPKLNAQEGPSGRPQRPEPGP